MAHRFGEMTQENQQGDIVLSGTKECLDVARLLLRHGANTDARIRLADIPRARRADCRYGDGCAALHVAAMTHRDVADMVEALLRAGAAPDVTTRGWTPLMSAAASSLKLTRCLLDAGASPLARATDGADAFQGVAHCTRLLNSYSNSDSCVWPTTLSAARLSALTRGSLRSTACRSRRSSQPRC
jgi:ankyrin repeat protein